MKLILIRGPAGSGKSTIARYLQSRSSSESVIHETDQYFMQNGEYRFDIAKIQQAHAWNLEKVRESLSRRLGLVIVANTLIQSWELAPYINLAREFNYEISYIRTPEPWNVTDLVNQNEHNVPFQVLQKHVRNYQPQAGEIAWADKSIFK